jgi:hypothetical protein
MRALKAADIEQLEAVQGMTKPLAARVFRYLNESQQHEQS